MTLYRLTERYTGHRFVYVNADSKADALKQARSGDTIDEDDPTHFNYRYCGPVVEVHAEVVGRCEA